MAERRVGEPVATAQDVRRAMWIILTAVAVATVLIMLTMKNSSPDAECRFLHERLSSGTATEDEFARADRLGCENKGL